MNLKRDSYFFFYGNMQTASLLLLGQVDEMFSTNYQVRFCDMLLFRHNRKFYQDLKKIQMSIEALKEMMK